MVPAPRRTKIVATLGPATDDRQVLADLIRAGVDVVRVNFSHGRFEDHARRVKLVRDAAESVGRYVGILGDLSGPKIRIDRFRDGVVTLREGERFTLDVSLDPNAGDQDAVGCAYKALPQDVHPGDVLLLNDGLIVLTVDHVHGPRVVTTVTTGGELSNNTGLNRRGGGLSAG
ncbi:MAG: pyruvate kinase, partial [Pseudomonadota bacterium]